MSVPVPEGAALDERRPARPRRALPRPARGRPRLRFRNQQPLCAACGSSPRGRTPKPDHLAELGDGHRRAPGAARARRPVYFGDEFVDTPVYDGAALGAGAAIDGPALIEEPFTVVVVPPGLALPRSTTTALRAHAPHAERARRASSDAPSCARDRRGRVDRLIPPDDDGARRAARPASPTTSTGCSARSRSTRRASGPADRSRAGTAATPAFDALPAARPRSRSWRGARASRARRASPSASSTARSSAGRSATATASPRSATTSPTLDRDEQDARLDAAREFQRLLYEHACEGTYGDPVYGGNRDRRRLARDRVRRRRPAARLHRRRGRRGRDREPSTATPSSSAPGPAGATVADVLTAAGWSVIILEKGRNHLLDLDAAVRAARPLRQRRDQVLPPPLPRPRPAARAAHLPPRPRTTATACSPATSTTCRRPSAAAASTPTPSSPASARTTSALRTERGPVDGADIVDWPLDYDELEPHYAEAERSSAWPARPAPTRSRRGAAARTRCRRAPTCSARCSSAAAAERRGLHPYRAPTGVNSVAYDGRPACNNCGFCGGYGCPIDAKGDPIAPLRRALRTGRCEIRPEALRRPTSCSTRAAAGPRGVRYLDSRDPDAPTRGAAPRTWCWPRGAFETPRLLLRNGLGELATLVGRYLMYHFQTFTVGIFPFRLHGERGRARHPPPRRPHGRRRRAARPPPRRRAAVAPRRHRRARRRPGTRSTEAHDLPAGRAAHAARCATRALRDRLWVFTMQGEDLPQADQPHRPRPDGARRVGLPRRPGHLLAAPPRARRRRATAAPRLEAVHARRRRRRRRSRSTSPPLGELDRRPQPARRRADLAPRHGHAPAWATTRARPSCRPAAAAPGRRQRARRRLVGVPDVDRLQPDAHARRARDPHVARARRPRTAPLDRDLRVARVRRRRLRSSPQPPSVGLRPKTSLTLSPTLSPTSPKVTFIASPIEFSASVSPSRTPGSLTAPLERADGLVHRLAERVEPRRRPRPDRVVAAQLLTASPAALA